jgi:hypothetical protein
MASGGRTGCETCRASVPYHNAGSGHALPFHSEQIGDKVLMSSTDTKPKSRAEREADEKAKRRADEAAIVAGLKQALDADEQLLGFARGRLAGGIRGKLSLGPEAFFAPFVNIGLTERRLVIQHINVETGRPGEILPHFYALGDIAALTFSDIETFGGETAARLTMRLRNDQHTRLRLRGQGNLESAQAIVEVFRSLTSAHRPTTTPTQRVCATCQHILDQPFKFCPYCGQQQDLTAAAPAATPTAEAEPERTYPPTPPGATEPEFLDAVPYQDAAAFRGPTVEDGLDFLTPEPTSEPSLSPETESATASVPEPDASATPEPEVSATPEPEASAVAPVAEADVDETPSEFEGWSVDPGASSAVVEPSEESGLAATPVDSVVEPFALAGGSIETEASVAEMIPEEAPAQSQTAVEADSYTDVHAIAAPEAPTVHPEAEFAQVPQPDAGAPATEEAQPRATFEAPLAESDPAPRAESARKPESRAVSATPDFVWAVPTVKVTPDVPPIPSGHAEVAPVTEFSAPPPAESLWAPAFASADPDEATAVAAPIPPQESAGFVTEPVTEVTQTPVSSFEPFAPVIEPTAVPEVTIATEGSEPVASPAGGADPVSAPMPVTAAEAANTVVSPLVPEQLEAQASQAADVASVTPNVAPPPPVSTPSEDRFAALLREIRGSEAPAEAEPPAPVVERRDGPMRVQVHINRPPIVVNETFPGRNADDVVGQLKARVLPELNFALRLMVNSFSNLRFAQEIVRRYNDREKTDYPVPNSCWEFLLNAESMGYATIQLNS